MPISVNSNFPTTQLTLIKDGEISQASSDEFFKDKNIILVGVPGAFTPTCHASHLPGYMDNLDAFNNKGWDVVFVAVNDPFVMQEWSKASSAQNINMIADGNCDLTNQLDLKMDASGFGLGNRCMRFAMHIKNCVISSLDVEEGGALDISAAETQLAKI